MTYQKTSDISVKPGDKYILPDHMLRWGLHLTLILSGGVAVLNALIYINGGNRTIAVIEVIRLIAILLFWLYGVGFKKYYIGMNGEILASWVGVCALMLAQGGVNSGNLIWMLIFGPLLIVTGTIRIGIAVCILTVAIIGGAYYAEMAGMLPTDFVFTPFRRALSASHAMVILGVVAWIVTRWRSDIIDQVNAQHLKERESDARKATLMIQLNHELRNPLAAIQAAADLLDAKSYENQKVEGLDAPKRGYIIKSIKASANHLLSVVNDVLDLERIEAGTIRRSDKAFSVRVLTDDVASIFAVKASAVGSKLMVRLAKNLHDSWIGQELKIRQVLVNLTSNAIKYAPGCSITISVSQFDGGLVFEVEDNGPGISDEVMGNMFSPFISTGSMSGSTGLGLYICKGMVEKAMGGSIAVSHAKSRGVVFTVRIPLKHTQNDTSDWEYIQSGILSVKTVGPNPHAIHGLNILLVEDDEVNSTLFSIALKEKGAIVRKAMTSQEALEIATTNYFDLALVDCSLGSASIEDGMQITPKLLQGGVPKIIGITGNASKEIVARWIGLGISKVIQKPVSLEDVFRTIGEVSRHQAKAPASL